MRLLIISCALIIHSFLWGQERFLELTVRAEENSKKLKYFEVLVNCEEGIDFKLRAKKKKITFYLAAGLNYKIIVTKKGYYQNIYELDLTDVPSSQFQDNFVSYELITALIQKSAPQPTEIYQLIYESRYGVLKEK
jgi:hypothetical protein